MEINDKLKIELWPSPKKKKAVLNSLNNSQRLRCFLQKQADMSGKQNDKMEEHYKTWHFFF
jgi:hypothetical protein